MAEPSLPQTADDLKAEEARKAQQCAQRWIAELTSAEKAQRRWLERAKRIARRYRDEAISGDGAVDPRRKRRFALLWSNVETIKPAIYARPPVPVVTRRFDDADPVARTASEVVERALISSIDLNDLDSVMRGCRDDYVLVARATSWERYVPTHGAEVTPEIALQVVGDGASAAEDDPKYVDEDGSPYEGEVQFREDGSPFGMGEPYRPVIYEESVTDYVNWEDFGHGPARTWDEVPFVYRRVYLSREELVERFGAIGKVIPLDWGPVQQGVRDVEANLQNKAAIYEIWDRRTKKAFWVSKSWSSRCLDERDDPLRLPGFFPCPKPMLGTTANDSCMPVPDAVYYQDQADEIDKITARIAELQDALKVRGFYASVQKTNLNALFNAENNTLIPVPEWAGVRERGGAKGMVEYWPIDMVVAALNALVEQRQLLINDVYQLTGISDILRGMNDPASTATAERMKGVWGTLRIRDKQKEIVRFARDILRIKAGVICTHFSQDTLAKVTNMKLPTAAEKQALVGQLQMQAQQAALQAQAMQAQQPPPMPGQPPAPAPQAPPPPQPTEEQQQILASPTWEEVMGLLQDNAMRQFRIDIETDSTVEPDETEQKAAATELVAAIGQFIVQWGPQVAAQPALAPLAAEVLKFAIRRFRAGRELESTIEQVMTQIMASPAPPQGEAAKPPDTTAVQVQALKNQGEQQKQQAEAVQADLDRQVEMRDQDLRAAEMRAKLAVVPRDANPQVAL